ncbi:DUF1015 domain-containing protein [Chloroflexota bacterium]
MEETDSGLLFCPCAASSCKVNLGALRRTKDRGRTERNKVAEIRPFYGIRYNLQLVKDLASAVCPPYDVITSEEQQALYKRSEYNFIRLEYGQELPGDDVLNNRYTRAAATLQQWLGQGILEKDATPSIYLHDHYFESKGQRRRRRGIIACIRLEEWEKGVVRPHEETMRGAKSDRLNLLRACQANLSAVFTLFDDPEQRVATLLASQERQRPSIDVTNSGGETHKVWAITEPEVIHQIASNLAPKPLYIADGHHRYETALAYRRQRGTSSPQAGENEASNFVMATLTAFSDPGLVVLPINRLVRGVPASALEGLRGELETFFELQSFPVGQLQPAQLVDSFLSRLEGRYDHQSMLGLFGLERDRFFLLRLRDYATWKSAMPGHLSESYRRMGVSILHHIVLEKLLGIDSQAKDRELGLAYSHDAVDAVQRVLAQEYQLLFLLGPAAPDMVKAIADCGDRAHWKSTYFSPKQPAGLVINSLV